MLGLDIGSRSLYLVRATAEGVWAYGQCPLPPESVVEGTVVAPTQVADALSHLVRAMRLRERSVILTVGGAQILTKWVLVPRMSLQELNESAPFEAPQHLPPSKEPMVYRFWVPPNVLEQGNEEKMPARLVAVPEALLYSRLDTALLAGLQPVGVVPETDAITHILTLGNKPESILWRGRAIAIVAIRYDYTEMTVARETQLEFARTLRIGFADAIETLQRAFGASFDEAEALFSEATLDDEGTLHFPETLGLAPLSLLGFLHNLTTEMRRLAEFQRSRYPEGSYLGLIESFILTGEGTTLQGLARYCSRSLGITCLNGNLLKGLNWKVPVEDKDPAYLNRYTAALGAVAGVVLPKSQETQETEVVAA